VEVDQGGERYVMEFHNGGRIKDKLHAAGKAPRGRTGTTITFWPDGSILDEVEFRAQTVLEHLQMYAFLNAGLEIRFKDERPGHEQSVEYRYAHGIVDFVKHLNQSKEALFKKVAH